MLTKVDSMELCMPGGEITFKPTIMSTQMFCSFHCSALVSSELVNTPNQNETWKSPNLAMEAIANLDNVCICYCAISSIVCTDMWNRMTFILPL